MQCLSTLRVSVVQDGDPTPLGLPDTTPGHMVTVASLVDIVCVNIACELAPSEVGKKIQRAKQVGVRALRCDSLRLDMGEPVDIVFNVPFCPLVISLLHICQGGN